MPRVAHTIQLLNSLYSTTGKDLVKLAADPANDEKVVMSDRLIIIAHNTGAAPNTVTIDSTALNNRLGSVTAASIAADGVTIFGPFVASGYVQPDGNLYFEASSAEVMFSVVKLP